MAGEEESEGSATYQDPREHQPYAQNVNRRDILSFLIDQGGTNLFYNVMKNDPDPENSAIEQVNAGFRV